MATHRFKCRICKKATNHTSSEEFGVMPEGIVFVQCLGCGVLGIENLANELKGIKDQLLDEVGGDCA